MKDVVPARISDELQYNKEDLSSFKGYKRTVLCIDNNYWKQVQDEKNKIRMAHILQQHIPRAPKADTTPNSSDGRYGTMEGTTREKPKLGELANWPQTIEPPKPTTSILGSDGKLTVAECTRRMTLGLCLCCGQSGHLARVCPRQMGRTLGVATARATNLKSGLDTDFVAKNKISYQEVRPLPLTVMNRLCTKFFSIFLFF